MIHSWPVWNVRHCFVCLALLYIGVLNAEADSSNPLKRTKIGALLTLSGPFAAAGEDCRRGIQAALEEGDTSSKLEFQYADSKNEAPAAISEFRRLVQVEKVSAVYLNRAAMAMPVNPLSRSLGIPFLGAVGHQAFVPQNEFAFQAWPSSADEGRFLAQQFLAKGYKRVALVYSEDEWTMASAAGFRSAFSSLGGTITWDTAVLSSDSDFQSLLLKVKQAAPDVLYFNVVLAQIGPLFRQTRALGIKAPGFTNFYVQKKDVVEAAGPGVLDGVGFYDIASNVGTLGRRLGLGAGEGVPSLAVVSYVSTLLLAQAAPLGREASSQELFEALSRQSTVHTPDADYQIEGRYIKFPLVLKYMKGGKAEVAP